MDKKAISVNSASLVDLKAELFRKQEEFKQQKLKSGDSSFVKPKFSERKKTDIWSKKNAGVLKRAQKDYEEKVEEEDAFEKSKRSLQAKARMYEKISHGSDIPEEDGSKVYLVDFQKKVIDKIVDEKEKMRERQETEEQEEIARQEEEILSKIDIPPPANEGEEWVDYVDSFGRSRRCMKKDLAELMKKDADVKKYIDPVESVKSSSSSKKMETPDLMSNDMYREMLRQKWEKEEREALNGPIHYANVQFDEIRTHGTGYYQFAKDEATRQEQLETLGDIRKQTVDERSRQERLKQKRKAMMEARLAKVKQRKMMREGGGILEPDDKKDNESDIGPKLEEMNNEKEEEKKTSESKEPEILTRDLNINKGAPVREWDKGKEELFAMSSEDRYYRERRDERPSEFAPPSFYYTGSNSGNQNLDKPVMKKSVHNSKQQQKERSIFKTPVIGADKIDDFLTWERQESSRVKQQGESVELKLQMTEINPKEIVLTREMVTQNRSSINDKKSSTKTENMHENLNIGEIPLPSNNETITAAGVDESLLSSSKDYDYQDNHLPEVPPKGWNEQPDFINNQIIPPPGPGISFPLPDLSVPPPPLLSYMPHDVVGTPHNPASIAKQSVEDISIAKHIGSTGTTESAVGPVPIVIPRSSIIDTRLMLNQDVEETDIQDHDIDSTVDKSDTSQIPESVSSGQSIFSSDPVVYSKNPS